MGNYQSKKYVLEKNVALEAMSTCPLDMKKHGAKVKTEIELLSAPNVELLTSARRKG